jgi:PTH1 family peptidyl-tRNA hydrolase
MKVVVGLGNPGERYAGTRHNVGFEVIDLLTPASQRSRASRRFDSFIVALAGESDQVLLVKPVTFMNLSGRPVREIMDYYQVPLENLLVVCDDFQLPLGTLRARARGTHGGHNGLRDIQQHLGTTEYARLRIGVGSPEEGQAVEHVLGRFGPGDRPIMIDAITRASQAADVWIAEGIDSCMNRYNG